MRRRFDEPGDTLAELGEGRLLDRLAAQAQGRQHPQVILGSGDDAAALLVPAGACVVTTQDALVEDVDFRRAWSTPSAVGSKALALSLSDLAAMGAHPLACTATVCAPPETRVDDLLALQAGLLLRGGKAGCPLVGGDLSAIDGPLVVDVCALGTALPGRLLRRDAGRVGDLLVVTGTLGRAAAGLALLEGSVAAAPTDASWAARARALQTHGRARLREGMALAAAGVRCAGDVSDGVAVDAARTAASSGCAAEIWADALPVDEQLRRLDGDAWLDLALGGGEDFELLAAVSPAALERLLASWERPPLAPLQVIGRLVEGRGLRLLEGRDGSELPLPQARSRHFASSPG